MILWPPKIREGPMEDLAAFSARLTSYRTNA